MSHDPDASSDTEPRTCGFVLPYEMIAWTSNSYDKPACTEVGLPLSGMEQPCFLLWCVIMCPVQQAQSTKYECKKQSYSATVDPPVYLSNILNVIHSNLDVFIHVGKVPFIQLWVYTQGPHTSSTFN